MLCSAWSPSIEDQLISGSLTAVSRILSGWRSSHLAAFFRYACTIGFFPNEEPAIILGMREVFPRR